ncbi:MAG TPA: hypothetical protein VEW71_09220 [Allosphingosinicella sp.]|nr:hypothetical protein [Allosphingosinicella sp.]
MALALMLVLQAAAVPAGPGPSGPPASAAPSAIDFDLARYRPAEAGTGLIGRGCRADDPTPIVVCARRSGGAYPIEEMARLFAVSPLVAEMRLGGAATGRIYGESAALDRGAVAQRIWVGIRLPF